MFNENMPWAIVISVFLVCFTLGSMRSCEYEHLEKMKCLELGHTTFPNGSCDLGKGKENEPGPKK